MTIAHLGIAVTGNADKAAVDLDKFTASAGKAEGATERLAAGSKTAATATAQLSQSLTREAGSLRAVDQAAVMAAAATGRATAATRAHSAAMQASTLNTANLAAQFNDIGVMLASGQSPMLLALQQGTQISQVLGPMGAGAAVRSLGSAFLAMINPVSIATIAAIGLGAAGIQALMGMMGSTEDATTALERHNEFLDETLEGYQKVRDAADDALEAALKLPEASVTSDLSARQADATERALAAMERVLELQREFQGYARYADAFGVPEDIAASLAEVDALITDLTSDASLSATELDRLHTAFTELANSTADQNIKDIANEALALVDSARQAAAEVGSLDTALRNIPRDVQIRLRISQEFAAAASGLSDLYMDPRSKYDVAREEAKNLADQASALAQSYGEAVGIGKEYERVLASIDAAEAAANEKANARASKAAAKPFDEWKTAVETMEQRIGQMRLESNVLGQTTFEVERQQAAFDLLNEAKSAGIPITASVIEQINALSMEYAEATEKLTRLKEVYDFGKSTFRGFFSDLRQGLSDGKNLWESLGNAAANALDKIADKALGMAADGLWDLIFGGISSIFGGGIGGASFGMFGRSAVTPLGFGGTAGIYPGFADGTPSAPGGWSWVGEKGPELVRLPRGTQVIPHQQSMTMSAANSNKVSVVRIELGEGLRAGIVQEAVGQSVEISGRMVEPVAKAVGRMGQQGRF